MHTFFGLLTLLLMVLFLGIVVWAFSSKRKKDFDAAARLPLEDDKPAERRTDGGKRDE